MFNVLAASDLLIDIIIIFKDIYKRKEISIILSPDIPTVVITV